MNLDPGYKPEFDSLKALLLDMAQERSVGVLLKMITDRLALRPHVELARIWLIKPGESCGTCPKSRLCQDQTSCLHLAANSGPLKEAGASDFRIPLGEGRVGMVASLGRGDRIEDIEKEPEWYRENPWARES